jgi:glycosyltransferase involved in cell wall biosynthesis
VKICLVGHHVAQPDEGVRQIAFCLGRELARRHPLAQVGIGDPGAWRAIRSFQPDIIHFVLSPTLLGLAVAKLLSLGWKPAATVISAPHPDLRFMGKQASLFKPDLLLVQEEDSESRFRALGFRTRFLPNGVDTGRFVPVDTPTKERLRQKYHVDIDKFVLLHVGALNRGRNLESLCALQGETTQVLVVGRASEGGDAAVAEHLRRSGCLVWTNYLPNLEEVYALSDCYVFPTTNRRYCVEMPLSVLEAMSCDLPVVTTRFGALPRAFEDGNGLVFADGRERLTAGADRIRRGLPTFTRDKVLPLDWSLVADQLEQEYISLLAPKAAR